MRCLRRCRLRRRMKPSYLRKIADPWVRGDAVNDFIYPRSTSRNSPSCPSRSVIIRHDPSTIDRIKDIDKHAKPRCDTARPHARRSKARRRCTFPTSHPARRVQATPSLHHRHNDVITTTGARHGRGGADPAAKIIDRNDTEIKTGRGGSTDEFWLAGRIRASGVGGWVIRGYSPLPFTDRTSWALEISRPRAVGTAEGCQDFGMP